YWSYYWLGEVLEAKGQEALREADRSGVASVKEARRQQAQRHFEAAELAYGVCVGLRPDYHDGFVKRGLTILEQSFQATEPRPGQLAARALKDLDAGCRIDEKDYYPIGIRGYAHSLLGEDDLAIKDFTRAIDLPPADLTNHPHYYKAYWLRGMTHLNAGR